MATLSEASKAMTAERESGSTIVWITMAEAAQRLQVDYRTMRRWIADGLIDARRFGPRLVRVNAASLDLAGDPLVWQEPMAS